MKKNTNNIFFPLLFIIITLLVMLIGTTFAYFTINVTKDTTKVNISGSIDDVGSVALNKGDDLSLNITVDKMSDKGKDVDYYATKDGIPAETKTEVAIASIIVNGKNTMKCKYTLLDSISGTKNMYEIFKNMPSATTGQLVLSINEKEYDFYNTDFPLKISNEIELSGNSKKEILASFKVVNKSNVDQTLLSGTDLNISFTFEEFSCELVG